MAVTNQTKEINTESLLKHVRMLNVAILTYVCMLTWSMYVAKPDKVVHDYSKCSESMGSLLLYMPILCSTML